MLKSQITIQTGCIFQAGGIPSARSKIVGIGCYSITGGIGPSFGVSQRFVLSGILRYDCLTFKTILGSPIALQDSQKGQFVNETLVN